MPTKAPFRTRGPAVIGPVVKAWRSMEHRAFSLGEFPHGRTEWNEAQHPHDRVGGGFRPGSAAILAAMRARCPRSREGKTVLLSRTHVDYYADLDQTEIETYRNTYLTTEVNAMGLAQILRQEGEKEGERKGREQGREEGRQQGEAAILTRLLELRFGSLDEVNRQRIKQADTDTLLTWSERVLTAESLEAVFRVQDDTEA